MHADRAKREAIARKYGADVFYASDEEEDIVQTVKREAGEDGVALVIDAAGVPIITDQAIAMLRTEAHSSVSA